MYKVVVGLSGGVSSAWCAGWAVKEFGKDNVILLFHDTKEEDEDTYRFIEDVSIALGMPITECSDGRSVTQVFRDENAIANTRMAFCSRILKLEQREKFFKSLMPKYELTNILGFSRNEVHRAQRAKAHSWKMGYVVRFPMIEQHVAKYTTVEWCKELGLRVPRMYCWSEHANCVGCVRGGKAYWQAVARHRPDVFEQRAKLEEELGHTILEDMSLRELAKTKLKLKVEMKEAIDIGSCECGD